MGFTYRFFIGQLINGLDIMLNLVPLSKIAQWYQLASHAQI